MRTLLLMSLAVPSDDWASACMCRATRKAEADRALLRDEIDASIMDETGLSVVAALSRSASACSASTAAPLETAEARAAAHSSAHAARASVSSAATSRAHSLCASQSASVAVGWAWSIRRMSAEICALTCASVAASRSILRTVNHRVSSASQRWRARAHIAAASRSIELSAAGCCSTSSSELVNAAASSSDTPP